MVKVCKGDSIFRGIRLGRPNLEAKQLSLSGRGPVFVEGEKEGSRFWKGVG